MRAHVLSVCLVALGLFAWLVWTGTASAEAEVDVRARRALNDASPAGRFRIESLTVPLASSPRAFLVSLQLPSGSFQSSDLSVFLYRPTDTKSGQIVVISGSPWQLSAGSEAGEIQAKSATVPASVLDDAWRVCLAIRDAEVVRQTTPAVGWMTACSVSAGVSITFLNGERSDFKLDLQGPPVRVEDLKRRAQYLVLQDVLRSALAEREWTPGVARASLETAALSGSGDAMIDAVAAYGDEEWVPLLRRVRAELTGAGGDASLADSTLVRVRRAIRACEADYQLSVERLRDILLGDRTSVDDAAYRHRLHIALALRSREHHLEVIRTSLRGDYATALESIASARRERYDPIEFAADSDAIKELDSGIVIEVAEWALRSDHKSLARELATHVWSTPCPDSAAVWSGSTHPRIRAFVILRTSVRPLAGKEFQDLIANESEPDVATYLFDRLANPSRGDAEHLCRSFERAFAHARKVGPQALASLRLLSAERFSELITREIRRGIQEAAKSALADPRLAASLRPRLESLASATAGVDSESK